MKIDGKPVINATKKIILHISPRDVAQGNNKDPGSCAAARACIRELGAKAARVHLGRTYVKFDDKWLRFGTSHALRTEIVAFDRGGKFSPGTYYISPLQPSHRPAGRRLGSVKTKVKIARKTHRKRAKIHIVSGVRAHGANR